jgi:hypothetical protein
MLRSVLAVIVSYIAMFILYFAVFTAAYLALGTDRVFEPNTYVVSPLWLTLAAVISFCGAIVAGYICAAMSKSMGVCQMLAVIVLVLGLLLCIPAIRADRTPRLRAGDVPNMEAMHQAQAPVWMHLLSPVIGAVGVLLGSRMKLGSAG